jgi:hypothetical protein
MKLNMKRCHECDREMSLCTVRSTEGEANDVRVRIDGMPVMQCPAGHRRFIAPDFAIFLMDALVDGDRLLPIHPASQKGLLRKRYCCPACQRELAVDETDRAEASRLLELNGLDAFHVSVEMPKLRCSSCRCEYVPPGDVVADHLMKASARAFRAASVSAT